MEDRKHDMRGDAWGHPGLPPRWTSSRKDGIGTAYNTASNLWYTLSHGIINEIYYPTVDRPQIRDLQFLFSDGTFFHEERKDLISHTSYIDDHTLGFSVISEDPDGRYRLFKEIIGDPHLPCLLMNARLEGDPELISIMNLYILLAPHLDVGGWGNTAERISVSGREIILAHRNGTFLALGGTLPFRKVSCGFVGTSDGWTDLSRHKTLRWSFDRAENGNVAAIAEIPFAPGEPFTIGLGFGWGRHAAISTLLQSLGIPFPAQKDRFLKQWHRICGGIFPLQEQAGDGGCLYRISHNILLAHEDKIFPGAMIASQSIPWGDHHDDLAGLGGYHLVWTRDLCHSALGLLASGDIETPYRALVYLAASQLPDGGFHQNFWVDGRPYWTGIQLDGVAHPVILAWRLRQAKALKDFDPYPLVMKAVRYMIINGPATQQDRWEEASGYSPSTLAAMIAALICAAQWARLRGEGALAIFIEDYADFLESHIEDWTVTRKGTLVPEIPQHYIRILPVDPGDLSPSEDPEEAVLTLANQPPGEPFRYPAREIVDGGFLELVRYGIRNAQDPLIVDSVKVIDEVLKVETPAGPCWRRYNHDGYGQREDGGPYLGWGQGRAWPLLTGERGHYELAAGRDPRPFIRAMEGFASAAGLLPEQVWDGQERPFRNCFPGKPTGAAMPLAWAHAEYIRLLRSAHDGRVFDLLDPVADRYLSLPGKKGRSELEIWKPNRQVRRVRPGKILRIQVPSPFTLHFSADGWAFAVDREAAATSLNIFYVDIPIHPSQLDPIQFTFFWTGEKRWEGKDHTVEVEAISHESLSGASASHF